MAQARKLVAILAADVVGYSRLMGEAEAGTARAVLEHREAAAPIVLGFGGRLVKTMGDGVLIEFPSIVAAVECAIAMQAQMVERNAGVPSDKRIVYRIGVNLGDVLIEGDDILGDGVNVAARLEGIAEPGGVCISEDAYRQVRGKIEGPFADLGEKALKNIARPVRVYAVGSSAAAPPPLEKPAPPTHSIAVLPFANMSGDAEQEYFADGISEDLITALSKLAQLFVIARNSSFVFKGKNVHVGEVSRSLNVRYVLEGSVRKSGNRVRVTAQLIDAHSGGHLWAERFDRDLVDIFAVQDDVTSRIVAALALNLTPSDQRQMQAEQTANLDAYDCFLRGRELWWVHARDTNARARDMLARATQLDPNFAPAYVFLAAAHVDDYVSGWSPSPERSLELGYEAALYARSLDDRYPMTYWALAFTHLWRGEHDESIAAVERSIALNPNFAEGYNGLGIILHYAGRSEEALKPFERGVALNPSCPGMWLHFRAQAAFQLRRFEAAVGLLQQRILRNPDTDASRVLLAASYGQMGRLEEAREAWAGALRVNPDYSLERRRKVLPYKNPGDFDLVVEGLRKAGVTP
jgi:adenylate cyclase